MILEKTARASLTAFELDVGDELHFRMSNGQVRRIRLERAHAAIDHTTLKKVKEPEFGAHTVLRMHARILVDGHAIDLVRWVGNQKSFYEPWEFFGLRLWFDGVAALFDHLNENHGACKPRKAARFAVQEAGARICPVLLHPWCPLPRGGLRIEDCYEGSDCWMGPYHGADAHGGLDINHPAGTPIWTPVPVQRHGLFNSLEKGDNNNRWRGFCEWGDGSVWVLQVHHLLRLRVPEERPLAAGTLLADGAGVWNGSHEHSHFAFKVTEPGCEESDAIPLDPWILFWQMYRDRAAALSHR
ncbi:MAG: hypothetical protein JJT96_03890 [Opitutales bacterium]|nr:hypothetical protein [Opitutales bacterium]